MKPRVQKTACDKRRVVQKEMIQLFAFSDHLSMEETSVAAVRILMHVELFVKTM